MTEYRQRAVRCLSPAGFHRMAYVEWGDPNSRRVLICVHGLTRCARDFDFLAQAMAAEGYRVVCPDVVGRGKSDWLREKAYYAMPQYLADMVVLIARLDVEAVDWLGTSMGGLIGMTLAAQSETPIARLILNDIGPVIVTRGLDRISEYVGNPPDFASFDEAEAYIRQVAASFGDLAPDEWHHLTEHAIKVTPAGRFALRYDPGIAAPFVASIKALAAQQRTGEDVELWPLYDMLHCQTLVIRGATSDLLARQTMTAMAERGPRARGVEIPGVGHAPMFLNAQQIGVVRDFLLGG